MSRFPDKPHEKSKSEFHSGKVDNQFNYKKNALQKFYFESTFQAVLITNETQQFVEPFLNSNFADVIKKFLLVLKDIFSTYTFKVKAENYLVFDLCIYYRSRSHSN